MNRKKSDTVIQLQQEIMNRNHSLVWIADSLTDGVYLIDPYEEWLPILYVNQKFTDMTGYPNDEIIRRKLDFLVDSDTNKDTLKKIKEVIQYEKRATVDIRVHHKNGTSLWRELYLNPLYNDQQELLAYIGIQKKITEMNAKNIFQTTLDTYSTLVSFINVDGIIEKTNADSPYIEMINPFVDKHYTTAVIDKDKEKVIKSFQGTLKGNVENIQIRIYDTNQNIVKLNTLLIPSYCDQGVNGAYSIYRMITGHTKTYKLSKSAEKYHTVRKMALCTTDILNPSLAMLKGFIELVRADSNSTPIYADLMLTEIDRIEQMITGYSLLSSPHMIKLETKNLKDLLTHICKFMYTSALKKSVNISLNYETNREQIKCDEKNLKFVFTQLVQNSIEAISTSGTILIDVTNHTNNSIRVRVTDEGEGISKESLKKVMLPFYTTKNYHIGLGLLICQNIIKEHKGLFTLNSTKEKGTVAEIILPFTPSKENKITRLKT